MYVWDYVEVKRRRRRRVSSGRPVKITFSIIQLTLLRDKSNYTARRPSERVLRSRSGLEGRGGGQRTRGEAKDQGRSSTIINHPQRLFPVGGGLWWGSQGGNPVVCYGVVPGRRRRIKSHTRGFSRRPISSVGRPRAKTMTTLFLPCTHAGRVILAPLHPFPPNGSVSFARVFGPVIQPYHTIKRYVIYTSVWMWMCIYQFFLFPARELTFFD